MAHTPHTKRAKISFHRHKGQKHRAGSESMVVFTPTTTRRGKTTYTEVDATPYYEPSDKGDESPKKKAPFSSWTPVPASSKEIFQGEASYLDDQEPFVSRITKVRLMLSCIIKV